MSRTDMKLLLRCHRRWPQSGALLSVWCHSLKGDLCLWLESNQQPFTCLVQVVEMHKLADILVSALRTDGRNTIQLCYERWCCEVYPPEGALQPPLLATTNRIKYTDSLAKHHVLTGMLTLTKKPLYLSFNNDGMLRCGNFKVWILAVVITVF